MPKRPSAITITPDDQSIIIADKFGDVYRMPLLIPANSTAQAARKDTSMSKGFRPSASYSTVHSARNRRALESQLETASKAQTSRKKEPPPFEHELLLGHVSMLTDLKYITVRDDTMSEGANNRNISRSYIITADRDEHIRISRGPPQSYVIEGFCLGHTEFISKLCILNTNMLVSGGGDDHLMIWNWRKGELVKIIPLGQSVEAVKTEIVGETLRNEKGSNGDNIAVSGIWVIPPSENRKVRPHVTVM